MSGAALQIFGAVLGFVGQQKQAKAAKKAREAQERIEQARQRQAELRAKRQAAAAQGEKVNLAAAQGGLSSGSSLNFGSFKTALDSARGSASVIQGNRQVALSAQNSAASGAMLSGLGGFIGDFGEYKSSQVT